MFYKIYALDSRNTDVLCTARANQGRRKQPAGLKNFTYFGKFSIRFLYRSAFGLQGTPGLAPSVKHLGIVHKLLYHF